METTPPQSSLRDPLVGRLFDDRYEVVERIGEGGMGAVYRARQVAMDRMVALKVIHPDQQADETVVKRFFREMQTTSRIAHPNTVNVHDFGKTPDGSFFLAMELLNGESLDKRIKLGPMPLAAALPIAIGILKGLAAAHAEHVVHRDLKPDNIMLCQVHGSPDQVKVLDFGIATFSSQSPEHRSARVTASGILVGTPSYVSPEQIGGEELDARSDLYAFGVLFYEMLTGRLPFHDPDRPLRVLQMHMTEIPAPPSSLVPEVPEWLDALVLRLLGKYVDDRPASATEVIETLESGRGGTLSISAPAPPSQPAAARPATLLWFIGLAVFVGLFGLAVGLLAR